MNVQIISWKDDEYHGRTITSAVITDNNNIKWLYDVHAYQDGHRELRVPEADGEFTEHEANGYDARSIDEALLTLAEGGYI